MGLIDIVFPIAVYTIYNYFEEYLSKYIYLKVIFFTILKNILLVAMWLAENVVSISERVFKIGVVFYAWKVDKHRFAFIIVLAFAHDSVRVYIGIK